MTMTRRTNNTESAELRAICGPVPQADGRIAVVFEAPDSDAWVYRLAPLNPQTKDATVGGLAPTPEAARDALKRQLPPSERAGWDEPFTTLPTGQPWQRRVVGEQSISAESVFARACYTGNVDLAMLSGEKLVKPNAIDANQTSLLTYAAGMRESRAPMDLLLDKGADPKRANIQGWTPAHAAAAIGEGDRVVSLAHAGAKPQFPDKNGQSPLALLPTEERKRITPSLPKVERPMANPAMNPKALKPNVLAPSRSQDRDVRSF